MGNVSQCEIFYWEKNYTSFQVKLNAFLVISKFQQLNFRFSVFLLNLCTFQDFSNSTGVNLQIYIHREMKWLANAESKWMQSKNLFINGCFKERKTFSNAFDNLLSTFSVFHTPAHELSYRRAWRRQFAQSVLQMVTRSIRQRPLSLLPEIALLLS